MRVSVVVSTVNRCPSLETLLGALRSQSFSDFEVVVVNGPSTDGTDRLLARHAGAIRVAECPEIHLSKSRNIGIETAAGDIIAFIDDDSIPDATWLQELVAAYGEGVSGAGGLVMGPSGTQLQYRYSLCDRLARTSFPNEPPGPQNTQPGADPFMYLQGTNASFLRSALVQVGGFDEEIAYMHDETELCATLIDAGHRLVALDGALVHHRFLPSHLRTKVGFTDPYHSVKNGAYLALRLGGGRATPEQIIQVQRERMAQMTAWARGSHRHDGLSAPQVARFVERAEAGLVVGVERGLAGVRQGRTLSAPDSESFLRFPVLQPPDRKRIVFTSVDYTPKPVAGVARFTEDLAVGMAARGHDVHVVTADDDAPYRIDFEHGVWVHRFPRFPRTLYELEGSRVCPGLEQSAAIHSAVDRIHRQRPIDVVCGPLWGAETLICALDGRFPVVTTCMTPLRTVASMHKNLATDPRTSATIALEDAALRVSDHLIPISEANARTIAEVDGVAARPTTTVHLGIVDHRREARRARAESDTKVRILFVGRLEARKGVDVLIDAAVALMRANPDVVLRIVGADNARWSGGENWGQRVRERADGDPELVRRVMFLGRLDDDELLQELADADIFCAPSLYESFGLMVAEAMMVGLAVVTTDTGGIPEVAVRDETALLVRPGDAAELQTALTRLADDPELRAQLAAAGRRRYETHFDNELVVDRLLDVLQGVASAPHRDGSEDAARARGVELLGQLVGLRGTAAANGAAALLDARRFPRDLSVQLKDVHGEDPTAVGLVVVEAVRGRRSELVEAEVPATVLYAGGSLRAATAAALDAAGVETDLLPAALELVPDKLPTEVLADIRRLWLQLDDEAFPAALVDLLVPDGDRSELHELARDTMQLSGRRILVTTLLAEPAVRRRVAPLAGADVVPMRTARELGDELRRIASSTTEDAIQIAYEVLIGCRADDAGRLTALEQLAHGTRADFVVNLAGTDSAIGYGTDPQVVNQLVEAIPDLRRAPRLAAVRRRSIGQRAERLIRDSLRDIRDAGVAARAAQAELARLRKDVALEIAAIQPPHITVAAPASGTEAGALRELTAEISTLSRRLVQTAEGAADAPGMGLDRNVRHAVARVEDRLRVMLTKYEALALDLRERLPPDVHEDLMEPQVLDDSALTPGVRVNLGSGEKPLHGYVNVDFRALPGVAVVADVRRLPFTEGSLAEVASHHLVEHFRQTHLEQVVLPYWAGLLAPDGVLRVVTPNLDVLTEWYRSGRIVDTEFKTVLFGLQDYGGDDHFALYSPRTLTVVLERGGFTDIEILETDRANGLAPEIEAIARPAR